MYHRRIRTTIVLALAVGYVAWIAIVISSVDRIRTRVGVNVAEITRLQQADLDVLHLEDQLLDQMTRRATKTDWDAAVETCLSQLDALVTDSPHLDETIDELRAVVAEYDRVCKLVEARGIDNLVVAMRLVRDRRRDGELAVHDAIASIRAATREDSESLAALWRHQQAAAIVAGAIALCLALLGVRHGRYIRSLRQAQGDLSEYSRNLDLMATHIDEVFWLLTPDERRLLYISPMASEILGLSDEELRENSDLWLQRAHPEDRAEIEARIAARGGQPDPSDRDHECRIILSDGSLRWIWMRSKPVLNARGEVTARAGVAADITDRKVAERRLREQKELTDSVVDCAAMLVIVVDRYGTIVRFNPACERLTGYTRDEVVGKQFDMFLIDEERDAVKQPFRHLTPDYFPSQRENYWVTRDGSRRLVSWSNSAIVDSDGQVQFVVGNGIDVTEQQSALEALTNSEERFRQLAESIREVFWLTDWVQKKFIYVSPTYEAVFGQDPSVPLADYSAPRRMVHPEDLERVASASHDALDAGQPYECEYRIRRPDGQERWVQVRAFPILDATGRVYRVAGITDDITAKKDAVRRDRLHTFVVNSAAEAMFTVSPEGVIVEANEVACDRLEFERSELVGKRFWEIDANVHEDSWSRHWASVVPSGSITVESVHRSRTGRMFPVELSIGHFTFEGDEFCCVFATDTSERKRATAEIEQSRARERTLYRELNHRVRNNLASLVTLVDVTRRDTTDVNAFARTIRARIQTMATVHSLLAQSRWAPTAMRELIVALTPPEHASRMSLSGDEITVPPRQAAALGIVIHELMTNSVKYGVLGHETGTLRITWTQVDEQPTGTLSRIRWQEEGGPNITAPPVPGSGSSLMDGLVRTDLRGRLDLHYPITGADHTIEIRLDAVPDFMQTRTPTHIATALTEPNTP